MRSLGWLSQDEVQELSRFTSTMRRCQWLSARWQLKHLLRQRLPSSRLNEVSITSRNQHGNSGIAPTVKFRGQDLKVNVSISHADDWVLVCVSDAPDWVIGCDLVLRNQPFDKLRNFWFTAQERTWATDDFRSAMIWGLKESYFKAIGFNRLFRPLEWDVITLTNQHAIQLLTQDDAVSFNAESSTGVVSVVETPELVVSRVSVRLKTPCTSPAWSVPNCDKSRLPVLTSS